MASKYAQVCMGSFAVSCAVLAHVGLLCLDLDCAAMGQ